MRKSYCQSWQLSNAYRITAPLLLNRGDSFFRSTVIHNLSTYFSDTVILRREEGEGGINLYAGIISGLKFFAGNYNVIQYVNRGIRFTKGVSWISISDSYSIEWWSRAGEEDEDRRARSQDVISRCKARSWIPHNRDGWNARKDAAAASVERRRMRKSRPKCIRMQNSTVSPHILLLESCIPRFKEDTLHKLIRWYQYRGSAAEERQGERERQKVTRNPGEAERNAVEPRARENFEWHFLIWYFRNTRY